MASGGSGVKSDDLAQAGQAQAQATAAYNQLAPTYAMMASGNDGLTQQQKANLLTAGSNATAGTTAAITGQGALEAARTGNAGSFASLADAAARSGQVQQSSNALGVQNTSDQIARQNQLAGLSGEAGLYDHASSLGASYLDLANKTNPTFLQQLGSQAAFGAVKAIQGAGSGG